MEKLKIDVGYGGLPLKKGWIGVDPYIKNPDVRALAWKLPYNNEVVDEIHSSHTLEHIKKLMVVPTLKEWYRVLKPEGVLTLMIPDLVWCCKHWLKNQTTGWDMDIIFGTQGRKGEFHKTGFNKKITEDYLAEAGFKIEKFERIETHGEKTLSFTCRKE